MGVLKCSHCQAIAEGKNFEEADVLIDHGLGLLKGNGCSGDPTRMTWDKDGKIDKEKGYVEKDPKPVAENNVKILVGSEKSDSKKDSKGDKDKPDETKNTTGQK